MLGYWKPHRMKMLLLLLSSLAVAGCVLTAPTQTSPGPLLSSDAIVALETFLEDFARQALAALVL